MADYLGDVYVGASVHHKFMTVNASGKPTTLGDSPSLILYVNGSVSGVTSGLTLTTDFDARTGLNHVKVQATTSVTGIAAGNEVQVLVATGSVSGISLNGYPICEFSLQNRYTNANVTAISTLVNANVTTYSTAIAANVTAASTNVGAVVTSISTIAPARVTAQGIDVGAIVTAVNTIVPARITAQGIDVGAIVTAANTNVGAVVTSINTIAPARVTAQGIDVGAIVTTINTVAPARVTSYSASGLAQLFVLDSGTTYAGAVAGSPVKEIADNAGGASLAVSAIAAGVWGAEVTTFATASSFGKQLGGTTALPANVTAITTQVPANVTTYSTQIAANVTAASTNVGAVVTAINTIAPANVTTASTNIGAVVTACNTIVNANVTSLANGIITWPTFDSSTLVNGRLDTNVGTMASVTVIGSGSAASLWRGA